MKGKEIDNHLRKIERTINDLIRMFQTIKHMQRLQSKSLILVETDTWRLTTNENEQSKLIQAHFKKQFSKELAEVSKIKPTAIKQPTQEEIRGTIYLLKSNISAGCDEINAELFENSPDTVYSLIAEV